MYPIYFPAVANSQKKKNKKKRINIYQLDVFLRWDYEPPHIQTVHQN